MNQQISENGGWLREFSGRSFNWNHLPKLPSHAAAIYAVSTIINALNDSGGLKNMNDSTRFFFSGLVGREARSIIGLRLLACLRRIGDRHLSFEPGKISPNKNKWNGLLSLPELLAETRNKDSTSAGWVERVFNAL